jgi:hypothetical protein
MRIKSSVAGLRGGYMNHDGSGDAKRKKNAEQ